MAVLSVHVSEDPARPLGHAIVTLGGLPRGLETFEFALSRHGFATNHLGLDGWQGAECWLQPEEAWFSGDVLKFVVHPDLVFQLENMPYQLTVRGQGLTGTAAATFVWPLQLELEEGTASSERKVIGGTRVHPGPQSSPEPTGAVPAVEPPPLPPWPEVGTADLTIPEMPIPQIGAGPDRVDDDQTQVPSKRPKPPQPPDSGGIAGRYHSHRLHPRSRRPRPMRSQPAKYPVASSPSRPDIILKMPFRMSHRHRRYRWPPANLWYKRAPPIRKASESP